MIKLIVSACVLWMILGPDPATAAKKKYYEHVYEPTASAPPLPPAYKPDLWPGNAKWACSSNASENFSSCADQLYAGVDGSCLADLGAHCCGACEATYEGWGIWRGFESVSGTSEVGAPARPRLEVELDYNTVAVSCSSDAQFEMQLKVAYSVDGSDGRCDSWKRLWRSDFSCEKGLSKGWPTSGAESLSANLPPATLPSDVCVRFTWLTDLIDCDISSSADCTGVAAGSRGSGGSWTVEDIQVIFTTTSSKAPY